MEIPEGAGEESRNSFTVATLLLVKHRHAVIQGQEPGQDRKSRFVDYAVDEALTF
jgi:hypothetical protein